MCKTCDFISAVFVAAKEDPHMNYSPVAGMLEEMEKQERIELFAGDCLLDEIDAELEDEKHWTVCHYFRCVNCRQFIFTGLYIRGVPIFKTMDSLLDVDLEKMLWGRVGAYFNK
ncbi:MAG: hypothetical protein J7621_02080 [Niastella sp.]|nr:hypothetical protein [Niastella sp.]